MKKDQLLLAEAYPRDRFAETSFICRIADLRIKIDLLLLGLSSFVYT